MLLHRRSLALFLTLVVVLLLWLTPCTPLPRRRSAANTLPSNILNATLGFQHIFAINLPTRSDRRDAMTLAAALSGLDITWVNGVAGRDVLDKALPGDPEGRLSGFTPGNKGSWRAHMDVLQRIVRENITAALILEDDADWDVRLKGQMQVFAQAAQAFTQPPPGGLPIADQFQGRRPPDFPLSQLARKSRPSLTPFGDDWDVLWLGHCGTEFPATGGPGGLPPLRVIIADDPTVPPPDHLRPHPFALQDSLAEQYPPHTRVVHASSGTVCTQAYAVSQAGARKLLWQFGLQTLTTGWDLMLRDWCDRLYHHTNTPSVSSESSRTSGGMGRGPVCVTVQPPLFSHHYGKGAASDITAPGGGFVNKQKEMTPYVRVSVRLNMGRLVNGEPPLDQWGNSGSSLTGG